MMQLVIEIPNYIYSYAIHYRYTEDDMFTVMEAVKNGRPLPKGHGDLIDRGELKKIIQENDPLSMKGFSVRLCDIYRATPIIEADKAERSGEK